MSRITVSVNGRAEPQAQGRLDPRSMYLVMERKEAIVREFVMDVYTLLHLKMDNQQDPMYTQGTLLSVMRHPRWESCDGDGASASRLGVPKHLSSFASRMKLKETESCRSWSDQEL